MEDLTHYLSLIRIQVEIQQLVQNTTWIASYNFCNVWRETMIPSKQVNVTIESRILLGEISGFLEWYQWLFQPLWVQNAVFHCVHWYTQSLFSLQVLCHHCPFWVGQGSPKGGFLSRLVKGSYLKCCFYTRICEM